MMRAIRSIAHQRGPALVAALILCGCSTPKEVRDLSLQTSRAATDLASALQKTSTATVTVHNARLTALRWMDDDTTSAQAALAERLAAASAVKDPVAAQYQAVMQFIATQQANLDKTEAANRQRQQELEKTLLVPNLNLTELRAISANLTDLGAEESVQSRVKTTADFISDVAKRVAAEKKKAEASQAESDKNANPKKLPTVP